MISYDLPAALQEKGCPSIPETLLTKASNIRQNGGVSNLLDKLVTVSDSAQRNKEILTEEIRLLNEEENKDNNFRAQYREKWTVKSSKELTQNWQQEITKYFDIMDKTAQTDSSLRERFNKYKADFDLLSKPLPDLTQAVQNSSNDSFAHGNSSGSHQIREDLLKLCDQLEELKRERNNLIERMKSISFPPEFTQILSADYRERGVLDEERLATKQLDELLTEPRESAQTNLRKQSDIMVNLRSKAVDYFGGTCSTGGGILTKLNVSADEYFSLDRDIKEAIKFYADLTNICCISQSKIEDYCKARSTEADEIVAGIESGTDHISAANSSSTSSGSLYSTQQFATTTTSSAPARPLPTYNTSPSFQPTMPAMPYPQFGGGWGQPQMCAPMMPALPNSYGGYPVYPTLMPQPMYNYYQAPTGYNMPPGAINQPQNQYMPGQPYHYNPGQPPNS